MNFNEDNLLTNHSHEIRLHNGCSVFVGSFRASKSWKALRDANVTGIVNVTSNTPNAFPNHFDYYTLPLADRANAPLLQHLDDVTSFIHQHTQNKNVLVHCYRGESRSVAIVWAYLMRYGHDLSLAAPLLRNVNPGLLEQVRLYKHQQCTEQQQCRHHHDEDVRTVVCAVEELQSSAPKRLVSSATTTGPSLLF